MAKRRFLNQYKDYGIGAIPFVLLATAALLYFIGIAQSDVEILDSSSDAPYFRPLTSRDHVIGSIDAPVQLVVYSDLSCKYCKAFFLTSLPALQKHFGDELVVA